MITETEKAAIKKIKYYRKNWNEYAKDILGVSLDQDQKDILEAIQNNRRVSIRSGHARGKDYVTAVACVCFLTLFAPSKVIVTAPTGRQVDGIMMAEIKRVYKKAKANLGGNVMSRGIKMSEDDTWYLLGFKTGDASGEAWTGFHSPNIMVAITEATGLDDQVFNAIEGVLQNNSHLVLAFNPLKMTGEAYQSTMSSLYKSFRLNCINAPNVVNYKRYLKGEITHNQYKKLEIPGQVDYKWIDEKIQKPGWVVKIPELVEQYDFEWNGEYYRPDDLFRVKVLGEFPHESEDSLIPLSLIEKAYEKYDNLTKEQIEGNKKEYDMMVGIDIAGMGRDFNIFAERSGMIVEALYPYFPSEKHETIHMEVAGRIVNIHNRNKGRNPKFFIDTIGEGAGVYSRIAEQNYDNIISVKGSYKSGDLTDKTKNLKFVNMRAYILWKLREALIDGLAIPRNDYLTEEVTKLKYFFNSNGRIQIEKKEKLKKQIGRSPDYSDALAQTFYPARSRKVKSNGSDLLNLTG